MEYKNREELEKILKKKIEEELQKDDFASLWLSEIKKAEQTLGYPLGNHHKHRPLIVVSKNNRIKKEIIFLTSKEGSLQIDINKCFGIKKLCKNFLWKEKSSVFKYKNKIIFFLTSEQLKLIARSCGFCDKQEIEGIYNQIKDRYHKRG